jgi:O-antigen/teichoic acid export membrane protein
MIEKLRVFINRFTKNKEAKNASWLIGGRIAQMLLSFFVSILTARYLGPSNYGIINYVNAYIAFFTSLCSLGLNSVIIKDFVDNPKEQGEAIGTSIFMRSITSVLSAITVICIVRIVDYDEPTTIIVAVLCSVSLLFQVFDTFNYWFQSRYESKITAIATFIAYVVTAIYRIVLLVFKKNVEWFAFATSIDYIVLGVLLFYSYKKYNGPKLSISFKKGKNLLRYSYHYILSGMMVAIYGQTDKFMLKQMLDETSVGYYSLASTINLTWVFVLQAIIDSMYPAIMNLYGIDKAKFERKNRQLYSIVIYISIVMAIMFMIFAPILIRILYGVEYLPSVGPLRIITWYTIFSYLGVARNAWIVCENKQKYLKYMYLSATFINIILNYFMIPLWGANGAAFASLITQVCTSLILPCFWKDMRPNVKLMIDAFLLRGIK